MKLEAEEMKRDREKIPPIELKPSAFKPVQRVSLKYSQVQDTKQKLFILVISSPPPHLKCQINVITELVPKFMPWK